MSLAGIIGSDYTPSYGQSPTTPQIQQYTQNNPQGPSALGIGDVSKGLEVVDGVTEDFYTDLANLKSFVGTMYRNYNIDVTKPDVTNEDAVKAHQLYLKASASLMNRSNNLRNSQELMKENMRNEAMGLSRTVDRMPGQTFAESYGQGDSYSLNDSEVRAWNQSVNQPLLGSAYNDAMAQYEVLVNDYVDRAEEAEARGDRGEAARLAEMARRIQKPMKADERELQIRQKNARTAAQNAQTAQDNLDLQAEKQASRDAITESYAIREMIENKDLTNPEQRKAAFRIYKDSIEEALLERDVAKDSGDERAVRYQERKLQLLTQPYTQEWNEAELAEIEEMYSRIGWNEARAKKAIADAEEKNAPTFEKEYHNNLMSTLSNKDGWKVGRDGMLEHNFLSSRSIGKGPNNVIDRLYIDPSSEEFVITFQKPPQGQASPDKRYSIHDPSSLFSDLVMGEGDLKPKDAAKVITQAGDFALSKDLQDMIGSSKSDREVNILMSDAINQLLNYEVDGSWWKSYNTKANESAPMLSFDNPIKFQLDKERSGSKEALVSGIRIVPTKESRNTLKVISDDGTHLQTFRSDRDGLSADAKVKDYLEKNGVRQALVNGTARVSGGNSPTQSQPQGGATSTITENSTVILGNGTEVSVAELLQGGQTIANLEQLLRNGQIQVK